MAPRYEPARGSTIARIAAGSIVCSEDVSQVSAKKSSLEDWQKEARRLELQGKDEQAALIREKVLRLAPVPWPVIDRKDLRELHQKALAPRSVFNKAKQRLFEFAEVAAALRERSMLHYTKDPEKVLLEVTRYGLEHKSMLGMTPLMMATDAGNVKLAETLLERGARLDAVDSLGRMPVHFALRRAFQNRDFAREKLGPLFALLCPSSIDLEVDDKRLRLTRLVHRPPNERSGALPIRRHVSRESAQDFPCGFVVRERERVIVGNRRVTALARPACGCARAVPDSRASSSVCAPSSAG